MRLACSVRKHRKFLGYDCRLRRGTGAGKLRRSAMRNSGVLVECHGRLGAKVAICALELPCGNAMITAGTLE